MAVVDEGAKLPSQGTRKKSAGKMDESRLLRILQAEEGRAAQFVGGTLAAARKDALQEYYRLPYGNEEEGWSGIVTSEVQDTVEWIMPELLEMFVTADDAVTFDPTRAADVKGAQQATDGCNYVFYKQNNGFVILYTAFKDALTLKNGAIHWRMQKKRLKTTRTLQGATAMQVAMAMKDLAGEDGDTEDIEVENATESVMMVPDAAGMLQPQAVLDCRICVVREENVCVIEAFEPENLLVQRDWTSPLLEDCPYVCRNMLVSLSDVWAMGFEDVTADDLAGSRDAVIGQDAQFRQNINGSNVDAVAENQGMEGPDKEDPSQTRGWLRIEYVLSDFDNDGIAERRRVIRTSDKILENEEVGQVEICTGSPILNTHRWDGMSMAELMSDLQRIKTQVTRAVLDNAQLANNPRNVVLTDGMGNPLVDVDDLLDGRPGVNIRVKSMDALRQDQTPFAGGQMFPLLEYVDQMGERRTGVSKQMQGTDPNALRTDRTAFEAGQLTNAAKARIKLIARILAETMVKPLFKGILKTLIEGEMQPIATKLRGEFVELNPAEWHDGYEMTAHVGTGTGDKDQQGAALTRILGAQQQVMQSPFGPLLVAPQQVYNTLGKLVENAGFKNVGDFFVDPKGKMPQPQQPPPPPQIAVAQINAQTEMQKLQASAQSRMRELLMEFQLKQKEAENSLALQASNDARDSQRQAVKDQRDAEIDSMKLLVQKYGIDQKSWTDLQLALLQMGQPNEAGLEQKPDPLEPLMAMMQQMMEMASAPAEVVRDPATGRVAGVRRGNGPVRPVARDESGRVTGLQ